MFILPRRELLCVSFVALLAGVVFQTPALKSQSFQPGAEATVMFDGHEARAGEVLVQFTGASSPATRRMAAQQIDADTDVPVGRGGLRRFHSRVFDVETLLAFFRTQPDVAFAEPNYILSADATPNDPQFPNLWGLLNTGQAIGTVLGVPGADIDAVSAWDVSKGSRSTTVAVIDTGVDYTHPDLAANIWSAPSAFTVNIGGLLITCPAGSHGYNAITRTCDPMDDHFHGTHVSGTIGAVGNNSLGVVGVNWIASIIAGKFLDSTGRGSTSNAIDAIDFMIQTKTQFAGTAAGNIRVLSNSWGGGGFSSALQTEISTANANNMLFVAAAGNNGANIDSSPHYPASYTVPNVLAVAATTSSDTLASFSNYGPVTVPLAAPGDNILSTTLGGAYRYASGTSMATPHVSGAAALVLSTCTLDTAALKNNLISNVDVVSALIGLVSTGGRLNVNRAIRACGTPVVPSPPTGLTASAGDSQVQLAWSASGGATSYKVKRSTTNGGPYATIASGVATTSYLDSGLTNGLTYYYVVSAVNSVGESANSAEVSATPILAVPLPPQNLKAAPGDARVSLTWLPSTGAAAYRVKRSLVKAGPYALIAEVAGTRFIDTTVTNGIKYFYVVSAINDAGESKNSNKASAVPMPVPMPPTGVTALPGVNAGEIALSWNASPWATSYKVKRSTTSGGPYSAGKKVTTVNLTQTGLRSGRTYFFVITAFNATGESGPSVEVSAEAR